MGVPGPWEVRCLPENVIFELKTVDSTSDFALEKLFGGWGEGGVRNTVPCLTGSVLRCPQTAGSAEFNLGLPWGGAGTQLLEPPALPLLPAWA